MDKPKIVFCVFFFAWPCTVSTIYRQAYKIAMQPPSPSSNKAKRGGGICGSGGGGQQLPPRGVKMSWASWLGLRVSMLVHSSSWAPSKPSGTLMW